MQHVAIYAGIALLLAFSLYRKGRRMIGERAFDRRRTLMRMLVLAGAFALILWVDAQQVDAGLADPRAAMMLALPFLLLGVAGGVGLGVVAARMAQFRPELLRPAAAQGAPAGRGVHCGIVRYRNR